MPISEKQQKILAFPYTRNYQSLICDGAVRSGKTSIMTVAFVDWAMREFNNTNFAICGKTVGSAIKNIVTPYMSLTYSKKYGITFNRADNKMTVRQGNKTNVFYIYGGKDESSYMLIQGITLAGVLLDEVALMTRSFVEQALARCSVDGARFWFNCNPDNPQHWFYTEWIEQAEKHKALHLHFLMTDNPSLSAETLERYENTYSGVFYDRYVRGLWVVAEGLVYPMFNREFHVVKTIPRPYEAYWISNDFGVQHPCIFQLWGLANGVYYMVDEYYHAGQDKNSKQKTNDEYLDDLVKFVNKKNIKLFYMDNAPIASSFNVLLKRKQLYNTTNADNNVLSGIQEVSSALKQGLIKINDCCTNAIKEFGIYSWDKKATQDQPVEINDDSMAALRYFVKSSKIAVPKRAKIPGVNY